MKGSFQRYREFMASVTNAFLILHKQMGTIDLICEKLQMKPENFDDTFSSQVLLHTIAVVANLSAADEQGIKTGQAFLCDVTGLKDISALYKDVSENNPHYFSRINVSGLFVRIVELGNALKEKMNHYGDFPVNTHIDMIIQWLEMLGNIYIQIYGTTPQQKQLFDDYISRMRDCQNELIAQGNTATPSSTSATQYIRPEETHQRQAHPSASIELEGLIGLNEIKHDVEELISLAKMNKMRAEKGLKCIPLSLHLVFTGNPGTGKTTVARILAKLYNEIGILSKGQLIEVDRSDLVAGYVGQTAIKTSEKIKEALGGVLFIDEAYTLAKDGNDFGQEAIDTILKAMEDNRDDFIVIVAGYQEPMERFINSNPGLKSRFNKFFLFPDYTAEELSVIFRQICRKYDYSVSDEAISAIDVSIASLVANKTDNFANAREVRNYFERLVANQALRLSKLKDVSEADLYTITIDDLEQT